MTPSATAPLEWSWQGGGLGRRDRVAGKLSSALILPFIVCEDYRELGYFAEIEHPAGVYSGGPLLSKPREPSSPPKFFSPAKFLRDAFQFDATIAVKRFELKIIRGGDRE